jgi:hypothetical protein
MAVVGGVGGGGDEVLPLLLQGHVHWNWAMVGGEVRRRQWGGEFYLNLEPTRVR